ncbi:MAG TPA: ECF transporter S component [Solirubrobacteraceae bacterium]|nr:ECF transporter S component [Solirubrobacteraceae bacterium]
MSWQLASLVIVCAALGAAVAWIELARPSARLVAIVACLGALAALGRDAFAAIPDVKPTTAIVVVCGMAFGAGPGFAVGALAALLSNMLLGQGPWTPWQMLGWGLVGLFGALVGRLTKRDAGPLTIALACAVAAELFNLVVDLFTLSTTGNHSLAAFGVVLATAAPFDATHVVASFVFGLAFGAPLLRILMRARARMAVRWGEAAKQAPVRAGAGTVAALIAAAVVASTVAPVPGARAGTSALGRARAYLIRAQNRDGGYGSSPGLPSSELFTAWAAIGLAAAGEPPGSVVRDGHSVVASIDAGARSLHGAGDIERTIIALRAAGAPPTAGGRHLLRELRADQDRDGSIGGLVNLTAFGVLAMRAARVGPGARPVAAAVRWLAAQQDAAGAFGYAGGRGTQGDVDDTASVIEALAAGDGPRRVIRRAARFLERAENRDGGMPEVPGETSNAQSTAWAVQGLIAARIAPRSVRRGRANPLVYLERLTSSSGAVAYSRGDTQTPVWVTGEALGALAGRALPVAPVPPIPRAAPHAASRRPTVRQLSDAVEGLVMHDVAPVAAGVAEGL